MSDDVPGHSPAFRFRRFANWFPLGLTYATLYMGRYNFNVYRNHAFELHALTNTQVGTIATVGLWVYAASLLVNGPLAERIGGRKAILIGVAGASLMNLAMALFLRGIATDANVLVGLSLLYGANMYFQSFGAISVVKVNSAWFHWRERGLIGGVFGSMISLGYYFALGIGGLVYAHLPFWALFLVPSCVLGTVLIVDLFLVRNRPSDAGHADFDTGDDAGDRAAPSPGPEPTVLEIASRVVEHPVLPTLALAEFCTGIVRQGLILYYGTFLAQVHGVTEKDTVRYQIASLGITVGGILGALLSGVLSDKVFGSRRAPVAFIFYLAQVFALVALGLVRSPYAAVFLVGFSCMWIFGVHGLLSGTASMDFGGRRAAATAAGLLDGVQYLGSGLVGFGLGALIDHYHWAIWPHVLVPFSARGRRAHAAPLERPPRHAGASLNPRERQLCLSGGPRRTLLFRFDAFRRSLAQIPLFQGLTDQDREVLATRLTEKTFKAGEIVFSQGDKGSSMYVVHSGAVQIYLPSAEKDQPPVVLKDVRSGEYFGELAIFDDKPRSASVRALVDTVLMELTRDELAEHLGRSQNAAMTILSEMANRLRETNAMLSQRATKDVMKEFEDNLTWSQRMADQVAELERKLGLHALPHRADLRMVGPEQVAAEALRRVPLPVLQPGSGDPRRPPRAFDRHEPEPADAQGPGTGRDGLPGQSQERGRHREDAGRARRDEGRAEQAPRSPRTRGAGRAPAGRGPDEDPRRAAQRALTALCGSP